MKQKSFLKEGRKATKNLSNIVGVIFLLTFLLFLPLGSSTLDGLGTFRQGDNVRVAQICSDATYINLSSISYPNSTIAVSNIEMISAGSGEFYYYFNYTDLNGRYDVRGISNGCEGTFATYFLITPNGGAFDISQAILFGFIFLLVTGILIFGIYGLTRASEVSWQIFYICLTYLMMFCLFFISWLFTSNYLYEMQILSSIFWILWFILAICFWPFIIGVSGYLLKLQAEALMVTEYQKQGFSKEDSRELAKTKRKR
jgi:hypothetical protein